MKWLGIDFEVLPCGMSEDALQVITDPSSPSKLGT